MTPKLPSAARLADAAETVLALAQFVAHHHQLLQSPAAVAASCSVFGVLLAETARGLRDGKTDALAFELAFEQASAKPFQGPALQSGHPAERLAVQLMQAAGQSFTGDFVLCARVIGPPCLVNEPALLVEFADGFHTHHRRDGEAGEAFRARVAADLLSRPRVRGPYDNVRLLLEVPGVAGKTSAQVLDAPEGIQ